MTTRVFEESEVVDEVLAGIDVRGESIAGIRFEGCTLDAWRATEVSLRDCVFDECVFRRCDLTMAKVFDSRFRGVRFEGCKLVGVDFAAAYALGFDVSFDGCVLNYAGFFGMRLQGLQVLRCNAIETVFDESDLRDAVFSESELGGARFTGADLRGADLSEATGYAIDPAYAKLKATKMSVEGALQTARLLGVEVA